MLGLRQDLEEPGERAQETGGGGGNRRAAWGEYTEIVQNLL